jgi:hypothetical protein
MCKLRFLNSIQLEESLKRLNFGVMDGILGIGFRLMCKNLNLNCRLYKHHKF